MNDLLKTKETLLKELQELRQENKSLKALYNKDDNDLNLSNDELIETNSRLSLALKAGNMAWWEMNVKTGNVTFDRLKVEMLGYSPENFKHYTDFTKLVHPADYNRIMDAMRGHFEGKYKNYEAEYRILTQSGVYIWFYDYGSVVKKDLNGKPLICTGFVYNITERKKAEEKLLFISKALESTSDAIGMLDVKGHPYYLNKAFSDLFGYESIEEIIAAGGGSVIINDPEAKKYIYGDIQKGKFQSGEVDMITKSGRVFPANERADVIKDSHGNVLGAIVIITDITERKQSMEVLRKSDQMLQTVLDNFPGVVFWKDRKSNYLGCNQSFATGAGLISPAEIVGKTDFNLPWSATEGENYRTDDTEVMDNGREKLHIIEMQHQSNGNVVWLDTSKFTLRDSVGQVIGVIGVSTDITRLKITEQELILANKTLGIQYGNTEKRAAELAIANEELHCQNEENEKLKDELEIRVEERTLQLAETNQNLQNEIEERKRNENELIIQSTALNAAANAIMISDNFGKIHWINNAFTMLTGYTIKEIIGQSPCLLKSGKQDVDFYKELWKTILGGKVWQGELINKRKDGSFYDEEMTITPLKDESGVIVRFIAVKNDITNRKKAEIELKKAKNEAEDANNMKSEFLANMSHEIRTPLNSIVGFSNILKERLTGHNIDTEYLDNIMLSSDMLLNLINDILDLSKIEAGKTVVNYHPVNLINIVSEIETVFRMKALESGVSLNFNFLNNIQVNLITDERYLRQILFNLIGNALKFTHKGSVDVQINIIQKIVNAGKVDLKFSIKDTGIGIQENELTSIFEPFIQASKKDRNRYGGTGLGLSITKRLVELLGGTISVESEIDKGSVFSFSLFNVEIISHQSKETEGNDTHFSQEIKFKNPVLLLTEDMLSNRQVIKGYLETLNITIIEAENGEECLKAIKIQRPDLILMDMQMPVMDGYTAINIIKSDDSLKNIPLIALSASGMTEQKDKIRMIADDFLLKPIYKDALIAKLMKYLPYEESILHEKLHNIVLNNEPTIEKSTDLLLPDMKAWMIQSFMPSISKQLNTLNIDELIALVDKLEVYNKEMQNNSLTEFCALLSGFIQSFNISKINITLKQLSSFINK
jgi:PAS domain S-box-containing protein